MHSIAEFIQKVAETNEKKIVELPQNLTDFWITQFGWITMIVDDIELRDTKSDKRVQQSRPN